MDRRPTFSCITATYCWFFVPVLNVSHQKLLISCKGTGKGEKHRARAASQKMNTSRLLLRSTGDYCSTMVVNASKVWIPLWKDFYKTFGHVQRCDRYIWQTWVDHQDWHPMWAIWMDTMGQLWATNVVVSEMKVTASNPNVSLTILHVRALI